MCLYSWVSFGFMEVTKGDSVNIAHTLQFQLLGAAWPHKKGAKATPHQQSYNTLRW